MGDYKSAYRDFSDSIHFGNWNILFLVDKI